MDIASTFSIAALIFLLKKVIDFGKQIKGDPNGAKTQAVVWIAGIGLFWLAAEAPSFGAIAIGDLGRTFADFNWAEKVLGGLALGSAASINNDALNAINSTTSIALPRLFGDKRKVKADTLADKTQ